MNKEMIKNEIELNEVKGQVENQVESDKISDEVIEATADKIVDEIVSKNSVASTAKKSKKSRKGSDRMSIAEMIDKSFIRTWYKVIFKSGYNKLAFGKKWALGLHALDLKEFGVRYLTIKDFEMYFSYSKRNKTWARLRDGFDIGSVIELTKESDIAVKSAIVKDQEAYANRLQIGLLNISDGEGIQSEIKGISIAFNRPESQVLRDLTDLGLEIQAE